MIIAKRDVQVSDRLEVVGAGQWRLKASCIEARHTKDGTHPSIYHALIRKGTDLLSFSKSRLVEPGIEPATFCTTIERV